MNYKVLILIFLITPTIFCQKGEESVQEEESNGNNKIVGGYNANIADFNYQVSVQVYHRGQYKHICGGSIVTTLHIVSAGHCYDDNPNGIYAIRAGSNVTKSGGQLRTVLSAQVHPFYNPKTIDYDVAVLKLRTALDFSGLVQPIALPPFGQEVDRNSPGTISGWGLTRLNGRLATSLQAVSVPVVNWSVCKSIYSDLTSNMICAGDLRNGGIDSCQGDSGGPFIQNGVNGKQLTGIVSWGYQCATRGYPGVYARVSSFRLWLDSVLV